MDYTQSDDQAIPRGIRNNNPGNEKTGQDWQGETGADGPFAIFADTSWGLRALAKDLYNKLTKDRLTTIRGIVTKYAPPIENQTDAYIAAVSADTGIGPDQVLTVDSPTLHLLMRAIINHENGDDQSWQYINDTDIDQGIGMIDASVSTIAQAAVIAAEAKPGQTALIALGLVSFAYYLFK